MPALNGMLNKFLVIKLLKYPIINNVVYKIRMKKGTQIDLLKKLIHIFCSSKSYRKLENKYQKLAGLFKLSKCIIYTAT